MGRYPNTPRVQPTGTVVRPEKQLLDFCNVTDTWLSGEGDKLKVLTELDPLSIDLFRGEGSRADDEVTERRL